MSVAREQNTAWKRTSYQLINRGGNRIFTLIKPVRIANIRSYLLGPGYLRLDSRLDEKKYILINNINGSTLELDINCALSDTTQLVLEGNIKPGCWISICWNLMLNTDITKLDVDWIQLIIARHSGISQGLLAHGIQHNISIITRMKVGIGSTEQYQLINLGQRLYASKKIY